MIIPYQELVQGCLGSKLDGMARRQMGKDILTAGGERRVAIPAAFELRCAVSTC